MPNFEILLNIPFAFMAVGLVFFPGNYSEKYRRFVTDENNNGWVLTMFFYYFICISVFYFWVV